MSVIQVLLVCSVFAMASTETMGCGPSGGGGTTSSSSGGGSGIPVIPPDSPVAAALAVLWKDIKSKADRHKALFARKRAELIARDHHDWQTETGQPKIIARVQQEIGVVETYLGKRLGTPSAPGPIMNGVGDKTPHHLDLDVMANYKKGLSTSDRKATADGFRSLRRERAETIVWRATALHPEVWQTANVALVEDVLDEMLDRRLRAIERMELSVNAGDDKTLSPLARSFDVASASGPWKDGYLTRFVEYAFLPEKPFKAVEAQMKYWVRSGDTLLFQPDPAPPVLFPPSTTAYWAFVSTDPIWIHYKKGARKPADVIADMFTPSEDFTKRCWLFCDETAAAVQIEALWFGKHRREGNDNTFNTLVDRTDYTYLGPLPHLMDTDKPRGVLMDDEPADTFFDNTAIAFADVEVGDWLAVWNNRIYGATGGGAWVNEYSFVMDVDSDPVAGASQDKVMLAGHGIKTRPGPQVAAELATILSDNLKNARKVLADAVKTDTTSTSFAWGEGRALVLWDPYAEFGALPRAQQAWWIELGPKYWKAEWGFASLQETADSVPRVVIAQSPAPTGYKPPPHPTDCMYFPLFAPVFPDNGFDGDAWKAYLASRANGDRGSVVLIELPVDGRLAPGLFYRRGQALPIVRPQVT